ncbi:MAG: Holliday junction branch migration protein RuvA [Clostridia bacterium]
MYYYFKGDLVHLEQNIAVIECNGVAYKLFITLNTYKNLYGKKEIVKLFSYLNVREDAMTLFGFYSEEELNGFKQLISVSGVGPKVAIAILSELLPQEFAVAVITNDPKTITRASGVGIKLAGRIILELKDKISKEQVSSNFPIKGNITIPINNNTSEALNALCVLGYSRQQAQQAISKISNLEELSLEDIIRNALKQLI